MRLGKQSPKGKAFLQNGNGMLSCVCQLAQMDELYIVELVEFHKERGLFLPSLLTRERERCYNEVINIVRIWTREEEQDEKDL